MVEIFLDEAVGSVTLAASSTLGSTVSTNKFAEVIAVQPFTHTPMPPKLSNNNAVILPLEELIRYTHLVDAGFYQL